MNTDPLNDRPRRDGLSSPAGVPLTERERRYRTLFGAMGEGFCVVEVIFDAAGKPRDYRFLEFNEAFERMTGITAESVFAGRSARELFPTLEEFWFETYGRVAATGESVRFENGAEAMGKWFEVHAFRIGGDGSREVGILFKDVSDRRRTDVERERLLHEAREREAFLSLLTDRLPVRVGYLGRDYRYRFVNGAYERAFGFAPGTGAGMSVAELAGEEAFRIAKPYLDRALSGDTHTQEFSVPYAFGERRVEVQYVADRDEAGEVRGVVVHVVDVTDRFAMTEALRAGEARYRTLFDALEEGFCVFEMIFDEAGRPVDYRFKEINDAFTAQTGLREEDVLGGKTIREMAPGHEPVWFERYGRVALTGEPLIIEDRAEALGRWYQVHAFRIGGEGSLEVGALFKDVTQSRAAQIAIEEERARQDHTLETAQVATFDWNVPDDRLYGNPLLNLFFGIAVAIGEPAPVARYFEAVHPDDRVALGNALGASMREGNRYEAQYRVFGSDGLERWVLTRGDTTHDPQGQPLRVSGIVFDVTERAQMEAERERLAKEVEAEREKLETLFQQAPAFIAVLRGRELVFEYVNEAYYGMVGHREIVGKPLLEALPEVVGQGYLELLRGVMDTGEPFVGRAMPVLLQRVPDAASEERFMDLTYQPAREADGTIYGILAHGVDVTDQVFARKAIAEREELFRTVFEQAPDDAILVMDRDRIVTAWNPAAERITGWTATEAVGQPADLIFSPEDRTEGAPEVEIAKAARDGKAEDERWHLRKDGGRFWGSGTMNALHDAEGGVRGYLKVFRDATARYEEAKTLAFLRRLSDAVVERPDPEGIVETVERMLGEHLGVSRVVYVEVSPDGEDLAVRQEWGPGMPSFVGTYRLDDFGEFVAGELRAGRTHVSHDAVREAGLGSDLAAVTTHRIGSGVSVPALTEGRLVSVMVVHQDAPRVWTPAEIAVVQQVADRTASEIDRARAEAALRASEERFRVAQEANPEPFEIMAAVRDEGGAVVDFRWTYLNPATERLTGERNADLIGASAVGRRPAMRDTPLFDAYVRTVETGEPFAHETPFRYGDRDCYMRLTVSKVGDGAATAFTDLTERFVEAQTLAFLSLLTEAVVDLREPERILETTERMVGEYLGASRVTFAEFAEDEETITIRQEWGPDVPSIAGTFALSAFGERIAREVGDGRTVVIRDAEVEFAGDEGLGALRTVAVRATISVPVLKDGRLVSVFVVHCRGARDWTDDEISLVQQVADRMSAEIERARAEAALRASEARFRQLVDLSPATVWFAEPDGGLSYISQDFYDATGLSPEESLAHGWTSVVHALDLPRVAEEWEAARREETPYDTEFRIRQRDGAYRWIGARALPMRDDGGLVVGWLGSNNDIQEQKETEETLRARVEERTAELQRAVSEAEGFNYSISHDLRTPLRAMVATASILLEEVGGALDEEHRELLVRQAENAKRLGRLIDELLRLSRLSRVAVNRQRLDMSAKAQSVFDELSQHDRTNGCRIDIQPGMTAEGDPDLVRTILHNLIGNACKFSPDGGTVRVSQSEGVFSVADEGVGFDMRFAPKIFLPFERLVSEREFAGTGIGLANVKRIVERHDGRVWVESAPGEGTTFFFTLEG